MKKIILIFCLSLIFIPNVNAITITSTSLVAQDIDSGRIFYEKNPDDKRLIASTTKIMTATLAIESNKLASIVEVGEEVLKMYGSNIYIEYKEHMTLLDLVYGLMLRSGNDAATTIAKFVGKTEEEFVKMMNEKAAYLGMDNTTFQNPTGLDDETKNISTATDLAILYSYAYKLPIFRQIVATKYHNTTTDYKSYTWKNKVKLLHDYKYLTGGKTGYTPLAKRVLVTSASNNDLNLVVASFSNNDYDYNLHKLIYEEIFQNYKNIKILDKDKFVITNNDKTYKIKEDFVYPLTKNEEAKIDKKVNFYNEDGEILIYLDNNILHKAKLYNDREIKKNNLLTKIKSFFSKIKSFF